MLLTKIRAGMLAGLGAALIIACSEQEKPNGVASDEGDENVVLSGVAALTSNPAIAGVAGCWRVTQGNHVGSLTLQQSGASLRGFMDWEKQDDALVTGSAGANQVAFVFENLRKNAKKEEFAAQVSANGRTLTGVAPANIKMRWMHCEAGCWSLTQEEYSGMLTLATKDGALTGFMDWSNHADATVTGTSADRKAELRFSYLGDKKGVTGIVRFKLSPDGMRTLEGVTFDEANPEVVVPVKGMSVACKEIAGCFNIHQVNKDNDAFTGLMRVGRDGSSLQGSVDWLNRPDGAFTGDLVERRLFIDLSSYPNASNEVLVGHYAIIIDAAGDYLTGSGAGNSGDQATLVGSRALCPAP